MIAMIVAKNKTTMMMCVMVLITGAAASVYAVENKPGKRSDAPAKVEPAATLVVKQDGTGDYRSVQEAINLSRPGDVIEIRDNGAYREAISLSSYPNRTIRAGKGNSPVLDTYGGIIKMGSNCILQGLRITNSMDDPWVWVIVSRDKSNWILTDCVIFGWKGRSNGHGILVMGGQKQVIKNNIIYDGAGAALQIGRSPVGGGTKNNVVKNNVFYNAGRAKKLTKLLAVHNKDGNNIIVSRGSKGHDARIDVWIAAARKGTADPEDLMKALFPKRELTVTSTPPRARRKNPYASQSPVGDIQALIDALPEKGGTINLLKGTYHITNTLKIYSRKNIVLKGAGKNLTVIKPIFSGMAAIDSRLSTGITIEAMKLVGEGIGLYRNSECTLRDLHLDGCSANTRFCDRITFKDIYCRKGHLGGAYLKNSSILNNTIEGKGNNQGIVFNPACSKNIIRGNKCSGGALGIYVYTASNDNIIENNVFSGAWSAGIQLTGSRGNIVRNNICHSNRRGVMVSRSTNNRIVNNVIYGNRTGIDTSGKSNDNTVASNTIDGNDDGIVARDNKFVVSNNIVSNCKKIGIQGTKTVSAYNNLWNNAGGDYKNCDKGAGDISADPLFADRSAKDFHLKSKSGRWDPKSKKWVKDAATSPCIDAGEPKAGYSKEPAPNGGRINMGAYGNTKEASRSM